MLLFDFLQEKTVSLKDIAVGSSHENNLGDIKLLLQIAEDVYLPETVSGIYLIPVMSPQSQIKVTGSREMKMVKHKLLRKTLNTTYHSAD